MTKKEKLLELKKKLDTIQNGDGFEETLIAQEIASFANRLKEDPTIKTLQKFNADLHRLNTDLLKAKSQSQSEDNQIRTDFSNQIELDLAPIQESIRQTQKELKQGIKNLTTEFEQRIRLLPRTPDLTADLESLRTEFEARINAIPKDDDTALEADLKNIQQQLQDMVLAASQEEKFNQEKLDKQLQALKKEINNRLNNLGGGQASPQFFVGGSDPLKRYRDINLKAGSNITLTVADNNTTKKAEITIAATGGAGSGIVRSINSISADTTAAATSTTDYVYLVSGTTTLTLPDATTNTNLYTIKNVGNGTVTVATTSAQTIDGALTQVMPVKFTSIDVISDTANWGIT